MVVGANDWITNTTMMDDVNDSSKLGLGKQYTDREACQMPPCCIVYRRHTTSALAGTEAALREGDR